MFEFIRYIYTTKKYYFHLCGSWWWVNSRHKSSILWKGQTQVELSNRMWHLQRNITHIKSFNHNSMTRATETLWTDTLHRTVDNTETMNVTKHETEKPKLLFTALQSPAERFRWARSRGEERGNLSTTNSRIICSPIQALVAAHSPPSSPPPHTHLGWKEIRSQRQKEGPPCVCVCVEVRVCMYLNVPAGACACVCVIDCERIGQWEDCMWSIFMWHRFSGHVRTQQAGDDEPEEEEGDRETAREENIRFLERKWAENIVFSWF